MGTVTPIFAARIEAEAVRQLLHEASEAAEARISTWKTDDVVVLDTIGLIHQSIWRIEQFAAGTKYWEEALHNLRYVAGEFPMTEHNLSVLLICLCVCDDRYRDAVA